MNENVKISIIIPVYNSEKYIARCLDSLLAQTYSLHEIIIIDDGSTDSSVEIINTYIEKAPFIKLFSQANARAAAARNNGLSRVTGTHIAFVDSDDYVHEKYIEILVNNMLENDAQASICGFYESAEDKFDYSRVGQRVITVKTGHEAMYDCCADNKTAIVSPCLKIYAKELFEGIRYPEGRSYEDLATTHKILYKAKKVVTTSEKLYCYYMTPQSVVHGKYSRFNFVSENTAQDERLEFFAGLGDPELKKKNIIAVQRNRMTNYSRASLYIKNKEDLKELRRKFKETDKALRNEFKIPMTDSLMFRGFKMFPWLYVHVLYKLYLFNSRRRRK